MAKNLWEDRNVEPRNAFDALKALRRARDLLEGLSEKPDLYAEYSAGADPVIKIGFTLFYFKFSWDGVKKFFFYFWL